MKTNNYSLEDGIKRKDNEIHQLRIQNETLEKELSKLQKVLKFNPFAKKEMKEKEYLESLTKKMETQEEEFKRTNETLRMEIVSLVGSNQRLKDKLVEVGFEDFDEEESVNCYEQARPDENESREGDLGRSKSDISLSQKNGGLASSPMKFAILKEKELLENKVIDLEAKYKSEVKHNEGLSHKLEEANMILESVKNQLEESEERARQRKMLIDEMKEHIEALQAKHSEEVSKMKADVEATLSDLKVSSDTNASLRKEMEDLKDSYTELDAKIASLIFEKEHLERAVEESKVETAKCQSRCAMRIKEVEMEKERALVLMTETSTLEVAEMKEKLIGKDDEIVRIKKELESASRKIEDSIEERKIQEKKALMMVKELKKQIGAEKRRADGLQEKLSQFLSESSAHTVHELELKNQARDHDNQLSVSKLACELNSTNQARDQDTSSSIGSWSFMPSGGGHNSTSNNSSAAKRTHRRNSSQVSGLSNPPLDNGGSDPVSSATNDLSICSNVSILESENSQLVSRMASMQEEKWMLEEKLASLQKSMDKLISENESKSQIIKFYCMEGRNDSSNSAKGTRSTSDKMTVRRVVDFIKDKGDENLKEINRKLQRILEETLIKNMHLHQDLERLTNQLVVVEKNSLSSESTSTLTNSGGGDEK